MKTNEKIVLLSAIRYALYRNSYVVGAVIEEVKAKKDIFYKSDIDVIIRDIKKAMEEYKQMRIKKEWEELIEFLTQK